MDEEKIVDPIKVLQQQYQDMSSVSERHLLQLESQGVISTVWIEKGNKEIFQARSGKDSFYLLLGELKYSINNKDTGIIRTKGNEIKPLEIANWCHQRR